MKHSEYSTEASSSLLKFDFNSEGPKGIIRKRILFEPINEDSNIYNLGFGDVDEYDQVSDKVISNNNDTQRILRTVASTIFIFFELHPNYQVFMMGSTRSRTRLYRMAISNNIESVRYEFDVFGLTVANQWELFEPNKPYEAFLITRKIK